MKTWCLLLLGVLVVIFGVSGGAQSRDVKLDRRLNEPLTPETLKRRLDAEEEELHRAQQDLLALGMNLRAAVISRNNEDDETHGNVQQVSHLPRNYVYGNVSFAAHVEGSPVDVEEEENVIFGGVDFTNGIAFNPVTSEATCQVSGSYYFEVSMGVQECRPNSARDPNACRIGMYKNEILIGGSAAHITVENPHVTIGVVTECIPRDVLSVRIRYGDVTLEGSTVGRETVFSGFKLHDSQSTHDDQQ